MILDDKPNFEEQLAATFTKANKTIGLLRNL